MNPGVQAKELNIRYISVAQDAGMLETAKPADFSYHIPACGVGRQKMHLHLAFSKPHSWLKNPPATYAPTFSIKETLSGLIVVERRQILRRDGSGILHDKLGIWLDSAKGYVLTIHAPASTKQRVMLNTYWNPRMNVTVAHPNNNREEYETIGRP